MVALAYNPNTDAVRWQIWVPPRQFSKTQSHNSNNNNNNKQIKKTGCTLSTKALVSISSTTTTTTRKKSQIIARCGCARKAKEENFKCLSNLPRPSPKIKEQMMGMHLSVKALSYSPNITKSQSIGQYTSWYYLLLKRSTKKYQI